MGYLVEGMKDVMVRGEGPQAALLPIAILLVFAVVVTFIATRLFKWDTRATIAGHGRRASPAVRSRASGTA